KGADAFSAATGHTLGGSSSGAGVSLLEGSALLATSPRVPWRFAELCMRRLRLKRMMRARNRKFADSSLEERVSCELVSEAPAGRSSRQPRGWGPREKRVNGSFWTI